MLRIFFLKMKQARNTKAKTEILKLITESGSALSHADIQSALEGLCDRVTIYRVLDRLSEEGLVHKVINSDGGIKYARCHNCSVTHCHNHIHFSCLKCLSVTCMEEVEPEFKLPQHYRVMAVHFTVSGFCPSCS